MLVFEERAKPEFPEKNLSEQSREQQTQPNMTPSPGIEPEPPTLIGGRRVLWYCVSPAPRYVTRYFTNCCLQLLFHCFHDAVVWKGLWWRSSSVMSLISFRSHRLPLVPNLREDGFGTQDRQSWPVVRTSRGGRHINSVKITTGTSVSSSAVNIFWKEASTGLCGQSRMACFCRRTLCCFHPIQRRNLQPSYCGVSVDLEHQNSGSEGNCLDKDLRTSLSQLLFFSTAHFPRLLSHFSPYSAACLCLVSAIAGNFPQGPALSRIVECLYSVRYRSDSMAVRTFQYFGHSPFWEAQDFQTLSQLFVLCWVFYS